MFEKIDSLPCAQRKPSIHDRNGEVGLGERRADVRRHVVGTFHGVPIIRMMLRSEPFEEVAQIGDHIRIGVLLNGERGGCVLAEQRQQPGRDVAFGDPIGDGRREVVEALACRSDFKAGGELLHAYV